MDDRWVNFVGKKRLKLTIHRSDSYGYRECSGYAEIKGEYQNWDAWRAEFFSVIDQD